MSSSSAHFIIPDFIKKVLFFLTFFVVLNIISYVILIKLLNMTKKEYILAVINALPDWEMWRWIKAMVQNDQLDEHTLNMLVILLDRAMDKIMAAIKENKMLEKIRAIQNFDKKKQKQAIEDEKSLQKLDSKIDNL